MRGVELRIIHRSPPAIADQAAIIVGWSPTCPPKAASARQERLQACTLLLELAQDRPRLLRERLRKHASVLEVPRSRDEPVEEERLRDVPVHLDDPFPVRLRKDP